MSSNLKVSVSDSEFLHIFWRKQWKNKDFPTKLGYFQGLSPWLLEHRRQKHCSDEMQGGYWTGQHQFPFLHNRCWK